MTIAGGTSGSCTWSISDAGALTVRPTSGTSGVLYHNILSQYPWKDYNSQITSAAFSGSIRLGMDMFGEVIDGSAIAMFQGCTNLTSVSGMSNLHGVVSVQGMFGSCSSLTTLDLTGFDVTNAQAKFMFSGCNALSTVTFGSAFSIADEGYTTGFVEPGKACTNTANGIVATTDDAFRALTAAERAGTWTRGVDASFKVTAQRSTVGVADEDGEDVTFSIIWATDASTTERTLTIYQKAASASSYPSTPAYTATLTGDSGVATPTLSSIGDDAYDFKVEFYDGTNTFIAYPSVQSNIRLFTLDQQGNGVLLGGLTLGTPLPVASGGTGKADAAAAWTALGGGSIGKKNSLAASDIPLATTSDQGAITAAEKKKLNAISIGTQSNFQQNADTNGKRWRLRLSNADPANLAADVSTDGGSTWSSSSATGSVYFSRTDHTHSQYFDNSTSRTKNTVLAAPNGSNGAASFRALVPADIPSLTLAKISDSGTLAGKSSGKVTAQCNAHVETETFSKIYTINASTTLTVDITNVTKKDHAAVGIKRITTGAQASIGVEGFHLDDTTLHVYLRNHSTSQQKEKTLGVQVGFVRNTGLTPAVTFS